MRRLLDNYGMLVILLALGVLFSAVTIKRQRNTGAAAVRELAGAVAAAAGAEETVLVAASGNPAAVAAARDLTALLAQRGYRRVEQVTGSPQAARAALDRLAAAGERPAAVALLGSAADWLLWRGLRETHPAFGNVPLLSPRTYLWPTFLKPSNLLAVVNRIVVIAVIAIGMTMVIITGGIDLSVGSLIAFASVTGALVMARLGGLTAPAWAVAVGFAAAIALCGVLGGVGGFLVARFRVAPFITTLALMMVARGLAFKVTGGSSIYQVPAALPWLGQARSLGVPNTVILLVALYVAAHVFMAHTRLGRYIYAVGGNEEAARLSGVPVRAVTVFVYVVSGIVAGIGGCIQASQINTGTPNCGYMYEMYVIAAVVVGGTSLSGGSGRILGTLIGAFIISVIQNGMNLLGIENHTQNIVLGLVILGAVLLDKLRGGAMGRMRA